MLVWKFWASGWKFFTCPMRIIAFFLVIVIMQLSWLFVGCGIWCIW